MRPSTQCRLRPAAPAPVLAFALDAARRLAPGLHLGNAVKVPPGGNGVVQLLVLGLVAVPGNQRPCSYSSWPATGKPRSYSAFSSAMRRRLVQLGRLIPLRCPAGRAAFAVADAGVGPVRIGDTNAVDRFRQKHLVLRDEEPCGRACVRFVCQSADSAVTCCVRPSGSGRSIRISSGPARNACARDARRSDRAEFPVTRKYVADFGEAIRSLRHQRAGLHASPPSQPIASAG